MCVNRYIKLLTVILSAFLLACVSLVEAQKSVSDYFGFHSEIIKANSITPISVNVTTYPNGGHHRTISETFGSLNQIGLKVGNPDLLEPDIVWVKDSNNLVKGDWLMIYYNEGWRALGLGDEDMRDYPLDYNRGFFIESRRSVDWLIIFGGYVKRDAMVYDIVNGRNILNRGYPLPITLDESGIAHSKVLARATPKTVPDTVEMYVDGEYGSYYFAEQDKSSNLTKGWKKVGEGNTDFGHVVIPSAFVVTVYGKGGRIILNPPKVLRRSKIIEIKNPVFPPPPKPFIYWTIQLNERFNNRPFFYAMWYSYNFKVRYTTEIIDAFGQIGNPNKWLAVHTQTGFAWLENTELLWTDASIIPLRLGVGRIVAEWDMPPSNKNK